jgi:mannose/cellobiose epimerase-like protein (N-acyl-D-glucosamine 2-epimerase family)
MVVLPFVGAITSPQDFLSWYLTYSVPLWARSGVDCFYGGYYEHLTHYGLPVKGRKRSLLIARQLYFFLAARELGYESDEINRIIDHGEDFLLSRCITTSGVLIKSCDFDGSNVDPTANLYDASFAILALAKLYRRSADPEYESIAIVILSSLEKDSFGSYYDSSFPRNRLANPHMHLFEAFLDWFSLQTSNQLVWSASIAELLRVVTDHFFSSIHQWLLNH